MGGPKLTLPLHPTPSFLPTLSSFQDADQYWSITPPAEQQLMESLQLDSTNISLRYFQICCAHALPPHPHLHPRPPTHTPTPPPTPPPTHTRPTHALYALLLWWGAAG